VVVFVVVNHPPVGGLADVVEASEEMPVQHLFAECAVEAFDERVLVRLVGLDVLDCHAVRFESAGERFAKKLRPVIGAHHLRQAMVVPDLLDHAQQSMRVDRGVDLYMQRLAVEAIDHV
jgi:hypothetical protein